MPAEESIEVQDKEQGPVSLSRGHTVGYRLSKAVGCCDEVVPRGREHAPLAEDFVGGFSRSLLGGNVTDAKGESMRK